ncbi:MAG: response regulator [Candidatus Competibacteraceae bacterium]|nr:response regulator [Candidatus Competibacteraceae bacterium]MBK9951322.1 response regulator [Candidatus Competibacteraceae bacterium]
MSISEDQLAGLEAEVAGLLGVLEELEIAGGQGIRRYADQVGRISSTAGALGFRGLKDICLLFQDGLKNSTLSDRGLNDAERERLEEWPTLVMGYLMSPSDPQAGEALLDHLQSPLWKIYLPANEAKVLHGLLMRDVPVIEAEPLAIEPTEPPAIEIPDTARTADRLAIITDESPEALATSSTAIAQAPSQATPALEPMAPLTAEAVSVHETERPAIAQLPDRVALPDALTSVEDDASIGALSQTTTESSSPIKTDALDAGASEAEYSTTDTPTASSDIGSAALVETALDAQEELVSPREPASNALLTSAQTTELVGQAMPDELLAKSDHEIAAERAEETALGAEATRETSAEAESQEQVADALEPQPEKALVAETDAALAEAFAEQSEATFAEVPEEALEETLEQEFADTPEEEPEEALEETFEATSEQDIAVASEETLEEDLEETLEEDTVAEADEDDEAAFALAASREAPNAAQQEMLEIICAEIAQIPELAEDSLTVAADAAGTPESRGEALSEYAERFELLANASESIGLAALQRVCSHLQANLSALSAQGNPISLRQRQLIETWPNLALDYLRALNDRAACEKLVRHLADSHWPQPLQPEETASLVDQLVAPKLIAEEMEVEVRPQQAQPEDVSLELPADGNQQLLDSLLQELPHQAAEFSTAIQRLAAGDGNLKDVEVAQRIAHTLKGAGNTVGVRGIATLTHHIEDILQAFSKHGALPNRTLASTLLNAADCLEIMTESLLGVSAPPAQALDVLQEVLDWANRIDRLGIPTGDEILPPAAERLAPSTQPEASQTEEAQPAAPATPEATLRIPAHMVDELLRLMGESFILTGQVQERVRKTLAQTKAMLAQNRSLQQLTTELEQLIDVRNVSSPLSKSMQRGDFDPLELEQYNELNTVTHRLLETATDSRELNRIIEDNLATLDSLLVDQSRLHRDSQQAVLRTRMVPIQTVAPRFQRSVRQTCRLVNKEADLVMRGTDTLVDSNVLNGMIDPLMHILRNAVDHGIELSDQRKRLGKPAAGRIELSFLREGNHIVIRCQDDGAGLNLPAIQRTAKERGLLASDKPLAEDELVRLILLPGFSTQSQTTQTSGRGIGMDVVYSRLLEMKGALRIQTKEGQGCLMELRLPVTLISTHALLIQVRNQVYALSDRGIEQILYYGVGTIQTVGNTTTYRLGNDIYELTSLGSLLKLPPDRRERTRVMPPVILVREDKGTIRAVLVEEIVASRDLVVKNLGAYIPRLEGIVGATILGDGSVAPVLDLPELLRTQNADYRLPTLSRTAAPESGGVQRQVVLAVDDSLSARRSLAQFIQDAGFEVRTARDGLEAIEAINRRKPDLILADLEMPRMNGLELTAHLRANSATHHLPIIMITSRSTDKHRREAEAMGVNAYLTKPFVEDDLLDHMHQLLSRT